MAGVAAVEEDVEEDVEEEEAVETEAELREQETNLRETAKW